MSRWSRRAVLAGGLTAALAGSVPWVRSSGSGVAPGDATVGNPDLTTQVAHHPDRPTRLTVRLDATVPPELSTLGVAVDGAATDVRSAGLARTDDGDELVRYAWTGERDTIAVRFDVDVRRTENGTFGGRDYAGTDRWLLAPVPVLGVTWADRSGGSARRAFPFVERATYGRVRADGPAHVGRRLLFVGEHSLRERRTPGATVRLVVPAHARPAAAPEAILDSLASAVGGLTAGGTDRRLTAFVATDPIRRGGRTVGSRTTGDDGSVGEFWVHESEAVDAARNVWLHEYVHTRQQFTPGPSMAWFVEASAVYRSARLTYEQGRITHDQLVAHLRPVRSVAADGTVEPNGERGEEVLTDRSTWHDHWTPYLKGAYVLLALDGTLGSTVGRSLEAVVAAVNRPGTLSYEDFVAAVSAVADRDMAAWCARYIDGPEIPPVRA